MLNKESISTENVGSTGNEVRGPDLAPNLEIFPRGPPQRTCAPSPTTSSHRYVAPLQLKRDKGRRVRRMRG
jgi:hypothetical protein